MSDTLPMLPRDPLVTWSVPVSGGGPPLEIEARPGEITTIVGANGSGKSALGYWLDSNSSGLSKRLIAHRRLVADRPDDVRRGGEETSTTAGTTIPRICSEAKVSTRNFYELYASKEDLFVDLYDHITAQSYSRVAASLEATTGTALPERVSAALLAYLDPMLKDPRVARIAFVEIMGASARIETLRLNYRETLIDVITTEGSAAFKRGEVPDRDWRFGALALIGALTAIVYDWALHRSRPSREALEAQLTDLAATLLAQ